ncbi:MAG: hypothetical protein K2Y37_14660 [Pirellulales bacterium]|nr:hypothetical protein [Pirellulales bacterium]
MARKPALLCDEATAETLDHLSKSQAIDLAIRLVRANYGRPDLNGAELVAAIEKEMQPIYLTRRDKQADLTGRYPKMLRAVADRVRAREARAAQDRAAKAMGFTDHAERSRAEYLASRPVPAGMNHYDGSRGQGARGFGN